MDRRNLRWWVSPPGPDESLRSLLGRVADLYESEPGELWSRLNAGDPQAAGEVDDPSCAALHRMAQALGVPGASLQAHRSTRRLACWRLRRERLFAPAAGPRTMRPRGPVVTAAPGPTYCGRCARFTGCTW